jgi:hypothetical protein
MLALTVVTMFPVTGEGIPPTILPYAAVRPQSKKTVVDALLAFTVPFMVAAAFDTPVAAVVTTVGGMATVVKVRSLPLEVPLTFTPFTRK